MSRTLCICPEYVSANKTRRKTRLNLNNCPSASLGVGYRVRVKTREKGKCGPNRGGGQKLSAYLTGLSKRCECQLDVKPRVRALGCARGVRGGAIACGRACVRACLRALACVRAPLRVGVPACLRARRAHAPRACLRACAPGRASSTARVRLGEGIPDSVGFFWLFG